MNGHVHGRGRRTALQKQKCPAAFWLPGKP